ncbi:MAG: N-acetyltransferase [Pseudanabaena frigida]|uniref:N-acetyltransferase n=1 Tax=Pseudanabaena frigida TaxID=945775 RepID=A0A2W4W0Y9_9CYAN|nr:MAG: N-acetyltransferase [Pseudanabaena frigida]
MFSYQVRDLTAEDESIVWTMLMYAAHESSIEAVQKQPYLCRYAEDWGREGDMGSVAFADNKPIGAVWLRLWSGSDRGFGYIDASIPELAMAVLPEYRGKGVGSKLLKAILEKAQGLFPAICLNVREDNPVVRLYERIGFVRVEGSKIVNRVGGVSFNMMYSNHK